MISTVEPGKAGIEYLKYILPGIELRKLNYFSIRGYDPSLI